MNVLGCGNLSQMRLQKARFFACFLVKRRLEGGKIGYMNI